MSDNDRKDLPPTDPWASWRKPTATPAVDAENKAKTSAPERPERAARPAAAVADSSAADVPAAAEAPASEPQGTSGTLSPRKVLKPAAADRPRVRGGSKPYEKRDSRPESSRERPAGKGFAKPGEARESKPWGKPAGEGRAPGKPGGRPEGARQDKPRSDKPWARPGSEERRPAPKPYGKPVDSSRENPWAGAAAKLRNEAPVKIAPPQPSTVKVEGDAPSGVRLSKVMSERGLCSRREADLWIERGWVFVDGEQISELGSRIAPDAEITISKEAVKDQAKAVTILLHKPVGYVSGQPEPGCIPAVTLIGLDNQVVQSGDPEFKPWMLRGLAPAGRLDVDSTGLLVLTSDGRVAKRLIGENSDAEKEYLVRVSGEMIKGGLELLRHGLELDGKPLKPAWVKQLNEDQLHFILKEGKKRQIRRMCELVGLKVIGLKRVRIGRIRLGDLPLGQWRFLRADEAF